MISRSFSLSTPSELNAEDVSNERFIVDDNVINLITTGDKPSVDGSLISGKEVHANDTNPNPLTKCPQSSTGDQSADDTHDHSQETQTFSFEAHDYANGMSLENINDRPGQDIGSFEENQNDDYCYITDALHASEEYLINESSF